ncbi:hypothetical protein NC653_027145 [Populus alba x Populus x berolinensis]|uniref:Bulb-type lectin domain-containing protein n=1 Tax=Populus alba x Populus x berolinensis TaxID=444605 RepID=A0AAD6Q4R7_9ROSI|nr:hypothetical protein NC653_027145 [Populus alba x Populus x berolinensis]
MLQFSSCTSHDSLKTNQTIKEGDILISKGDNFALGFFRPGSSSNRYLGIWYHKVPEKTVVWVANRNDPIIGSSGFLFINQHGNLVLYGNDDLKLPVWSTNVSVEENDTCEAQLLDSGNLILVRKRSRKTVWQSFDYPTNILLPGMKLGLDRKLGIDRFLTSWRSAEDPGIGDFSLMINPNGSPQIFLYNGTKPISRSPPWPWRSQTGLYKSTFVNDPDEIYWPGPEQDFLNPRAELHKYLQEHNLLTILETFGQSRHRGKVILIKLKLDGTEVLMQEQTARWLPKPKLMSRLLGATNSLFLHHVCVEGELSLITIVAFHVQILD